MSFYHILPSNTSPAYFPANNASQYSTPIENAYDVAGSWELALMNMTYSNCINTFNNDVITIDRHNTIKNFVAKSSKPVKVMLSMPKKGTPIDVVCDMYEQVKETFKDLVTITLSKDKKYITWSIIEEMHAFLVLSHTLYHNLFALWSDVISPFCGKNNSNYFPFGEPLRGYKFPTDPNDLFIIWVPMHYNVKSFTLKHTHEVITSGALLQRFNSQIPKEIASLSLSDTKFVMHKHRNDKYVIFYSKQLYYALQFRMGGRRSKGDQKFLHYSFGAEKDEWKVFLYSLDEIIPYSATTSTKVVLPPISFKSQSAAMPYINKQVNDNRITFSCNDANYVSLDIADKNLTLTFDDALRDIFAFDKNSYTGVGKFTASSTFSLSRRIQYLYIYSNISEFIRIGDTSAPLLGIIPFKTKDSCHILTEKIFKMPMYVRLLSNHISQIDIGIYDGAGQLVPFVEDAVTTLRLHFRQI